MKHLLKTIDLGHIILDKHGDDRAELIAWCGFRGDESLIEFDVNEGVNCPDCLELAGLHLLSEEE